MNLRRAARMILIDTTKRVLLIRIRNTGVVEDLINPLRADFWVTPGGGIKNDESPEQAILRELWEETGINQAEIVGEIGKGEHVLNWKGEATRLHEAFYLVKVSAELPIDIGNMEEMEADTYREHRWWSLEQLLRSQDMFVPQGLPQLVKGVLANGIPLEPIEIDLSTPRR